MAGEIPIKIEVKPEDIEAAIVKAVVDSALGGKIANQVNRLAADWELTKVVNESLKEHVRFTMLSLFEQEPYKGMIQRAVAEQITEDTINDVVRRGLDKLKERY